ncbi:FtsW/RodA/SpoVE family cell cycle protein [Clostridium beijerinckii]|uniref:Cell division protein FtsW (Lipid II flippase) n=1 Tax=Clostridium beijerinckii TaxID=1520 RepID=A0AAX0AWU6_CLOBE|nr:FtsW/RodA/SpoVE family cell cycle protein [Clostridium beijerinckii]NRT87367.1 cell division protein FtsW (lipid II flippase) [Clostridium beijerinckii]NYC72799.1 cell division protein FtsW (lipid II flippase) [Clostridium beijerinckii]
MGNDTIENYLKEVCSYIKNKDVHQEISEEIRNHISEIADEYINDGLEEVESIDKAIERFGSAYECGTRLNKVHRAKPDIITIMLAMALASIGVFAMYSMSENSSTFYESTFNNIIGLIIGGIIGVGTYFFDYRKLKKYSYYIFWLSVIILIISSMNANTFHVIQIGEFSISEVSVHLSVVTLVLIGLSGIINIRSINNKIDLALIGTMAIMPLIVFYSASDITIGLVYLCGINVIFLSSKVSKSLKKSLIYIETIFVVISLFLLLREPYRIKRIYSLINPTRDLRGDGYTISRIRNLLSNVTLLGNKLSVKELKIGDVKSNFALIYTIYNFGIIFGGICISAMIVFVARIFSIMRKVKDSYGKMLVLSIGYVFFVQTIINILSNLGIMGIYINLPFICFGSMDYIVSISMVGLICSIYRRRGLSDRAVS